MVDEAVQEIEELINEEHRRRQEMAAEGKRQALASSRPRKRKQVRGAVREGPNAPVVPAQREGGVRCLYGWTCGPHGDGPCPHAEVCADWAPPVVRCSGCIRNSGTFEQGGKTWICCVRNPQSPQPMPVYGYCSEGVLAPVNVPGGAL